MTIVLIILTVQKVLYSCYCDWKYQTITNESINNVLTFYFVIYANFLQLNLFEVAQCLLFEVTRYKYIQTN